MHKLLVSDSGGYPEYSANGPDGRYQVANLVMRLLLSKDGVVLRRLLMTAVRIMIYIILMLVFIALFLVKPASLQLYYILQFSIYLGTLMRISTVISKLHTY